MATEAASRYRVEELAAEAKCSVDTVRFYQKRRLLPPPTREGRVGWYGADHLARLRRIRDLQSAGLPLAVIGRIVRDDPRFTAGDVALVDAGRRLVDAGIPVDALVELARSQQDVARALAERVVAMLDAHVRAPLQDTPLTDDERAERLEEAFRTMLPAVTALVASHFERVLLETAERHFET